MQRTSFLGDILGTLFERGRSAIAEPDKRSITELCHSLLSAEGEVSGAKLAAKVLAKYRALKMPEKKAFFAFLNDELDVDAPSLIRLAQAYAASRDTDTYCALQRACEPARQELLRRLNQPVGATAEIVAMRVDLLAAMREEPALRRTDEDFRHLLRSWFNRGFLVLRPINWNTSANVLEKIVAYEAVHAIDGWEELRRRVYPQDRRCIAFFHPSMPDEPLIFVEVALTPGIPGSVDALLQSDRTPQDPHQATTAVFYSISNCQAGLAGVSFGNLLIKQVAELLSSELPQLTTFVTLSPIPGLNRWLSAQTDPRAEALLSGLAAPDVARGLAAQYLLEAKRDDGLPLDPVSRFHLGNGASVHAVHAAADSSEKGLQQSSGLMVNYLYDLQMTERNHEDYASRKSIAASKEIRALAKAAAKPQTEPAKKEAKS